MKIASIFLLLLTISCATFGYAQTAATTNNTSNLVPGSMVQDEILALQFIGGGSPLTPQERQVAASIVAMGIRSSPAAWTADDKNMQQTLAVVAGGDAARINALREADRYVYAFTAPESTKFAQEFAIEQRIIDAHDPIVVIDRTHKRLVTQHSLEILRQASAWTAQSYKFPGPGPNFKTIVADDLKAQLATVDPPIGDGIAHIERDSLSAPAYFASLSAEQRNNFFTRNIDKTFHNMQDPASEQWQIAEAAGMISGFAAKQTQNQGAFHATTSSLLRSQQRQLNALHNAGVSGSPGCNVTVGSYSDRAANGCYK